MSAIRYLVTNAGVQMVVIIVVKIVGDAGLRVGQVGKNRPLADLEYLGFKPGPDTFRLHIAVAVALPGTTASALRAQGFVIMQQLTVGVAAVLAAPPGTTAVGVDSKG